MRHGFYIFALVLAGCTSRPGPADRGIAGSSTPPGVTNNPAMSVLGAPETASPDASKAPDVKGALEFLAKNYKGVVPNQIDSKTIGVTWEYGAEKAFKALHATLRKEFGVEMAITAIE